MMSPMTRIVGCVACLALGVDALTSPELAPWIAMICALSAIACSVQFARGKQL